MEQDNSILTFSLSPSQLKYKDILNKDYLELEIYAISDIEPNRNGSHFTLEALQNGMKTFKNKPIVGFFEKGDFVEHNGYIDKDFETGNKYWNTDYGERILGFIRESDVVELVEWKGHTWIHFTCVLCIHYCYKQAKRLLKDRNKKVSVEVKILRSEIDEKGIKQIYDFNLEGVTILGSKNGKPILEAIPDAHASILERLDNAVLEGQREVLCFAYQNFQDNADVNANKTNSNKEESAVDEKQLSVENAEEEKHTTEEECKNSVEEECKNSVDETDCKNSAEGEPAAEETCTEKPAEEECKNSAEENECGDKCAADGEEKEGCDCEDKDKDDDDADDEDDKDDDKGDEDYSHGPDCTCPDCMAKKCEELTAKCAAFEAENTQLKEQLSSCQDYASIKERMEKAEAKLFAIHCNDLKMKARELMSAEKLSEETCKAIEEKCSEGKYASEEDMERDVAFAIFKAHSNTPRHEEYSASIVAPETKIEKKKPQDRKERIKRYAQGK